MARMKKRIKLMFGVCTTSLPHFGQYPDKAILFAPWDAEHPCFMRDMM
jgi:hypothetical protein